MTVTLGVFRRSAILATALAPLAPLAALPAPSLQSDAESAGEKGLPVSASAPSFLPLHLTGRHEGKAACPLCVHGLVPQLQIWVQEDQLAKGLPIARQAERLCASPREAEGGAAALVAYVILVPTAGGKVTDATRKTVRETGFERVYFVQVPAWEDSATSRLYGHSDKDRPGVRVYSVVNRRVLARWDAPTVADFDAIAKTFAASAKLVVTHEIADSQIAPSWEPGERMEIEFLVVDAKNQPLPRLEVSAMQADTNGLYNPPGWNRRAPRLATHAWTDEHGKITFRTIVPGPYPSKTEPAHIHFSAVVHGKPRFRTLWFEGDPLLSAERRAWEAKDEETVIVPVVREKNGIQVRHTFVIAK